MFARLGTWALTVIPTQSALINFLSQSSGERLLMGPMALLLAVVSAIVARRGTDIRSTLIAESEDFASRARYAAETSSTSVVPLNRCTLTWGCDGLPACQLPTGSSVAADRFDTFDGYRALASG